MHDSIINNIACDLSIARGDSEHEVSWKNRVVYSCIGLNMLAAACDYDDERYESIDESASVSMQHVLHRGKELYDILGIMDDQNKADDIRAQYVKTGYLLHKANRLTLASKSYGRCDDLYLTRGQAAWNVTNMSGLGTFQTDFISEPTMLWDKLFCIERNSILSRLKLVEKEIKWKTQNILPENVEYANILDTPLAGYWTKKPPQKDITICRDIIKGERKYSFIRVSDKYEICPIADWQTQNEEYYRITLALRIKAGYEHQLRILHDGQMAWINSDYLLPPFEQNLFELFSWPNSANSRFNRMASVQILPLLKELFHRMNFHVIEEQKHGNS